MRFVSLIAVLMLASATFALLGTAVRAFAIGRRRRAAATFGAWLGVVGIYGMALVGVSLASQERVLAPGEEKRFCALDCDLAYSVAEVIRSNHEARGRHVLIIRVRVRSDAKIARMRPSDFDAWLLTPGGKRIDPVAVAPSEAIGDLGPGESELIELQFDVPDGAPLRLAVAEGGWPTRLVIGDENSFLHRRTVFRLQDPLNASAQSPSGH